MPRITRRDFLNGVALTVASGLTPAAQVAADPARYPPALTGMRGQHEGSFEVAHAVGREGWRYPIESLAIEESYDLVVVGGGISGLAAAWFYRRAAGDDARILVLDNHDDFGGHAKRNDFTINGRTLIGYGGSQSLQSPKTLYSPVARGLLRDLGVTLGAFQTAFDRSFYPSLGLSRGVFLARETFGRDVLVAGDALTVPQGEGAQINARPLGEFVAELPITDSSKAQLLALYDAGRDALRGKSPAEKKAFLKKTSYRDYLMKTCGCSEEVANCFQGRPLGFFGLGCDAVPAADLAEFGYPGFAGLGLTAEHAAERREPYIYHFPDGNAAIARLLVRALIPNAAPGHTMDDVVLAPFDYANLDRIEQNVRVRLNSTCVDVREQDVKVRIGYVRDGTTRRVETKHAVLACFHMMIPHIMPSLPAAQREALASNVKTPLVYTNVLVRDWRPWIELKVSSISAPMSFHNTVSLDFPVSMGGYQHARDPGEPMLLHLAHVPGAPGLDARTQFRIGQIKIYQMTFADFEERIRDELDRMLGPGGFVSARDIAAITVNRWPHGYGYAANSLFDPDDYDETVVKRARQTVGRVAIANSDAGGDAYVHLAIDQAERAVRELLQQ
ncbi:MAG: NAD(P)/FAD-dependent oxidoreductase [Hyphomicrobiales bacterium]|nr:NAD(P)/FAD-dependent oxidoreductase [Hyphomicrobiales bacterium]MBV8827382.1 NAD(P)/FAD-dependent oxidoreductase [Hyphomicrobiales bacterium]